MNGLIRKIHLALLPTTILLACWWLSSCSKEDEEIIESGDTSLRITITTDGIGDLNATRAYNGDTNAEAGEFMNTLCVFICKSDGTIEKKLATDCLDGIAEAEAGNLQQYTWIVDDITPGTKTIYAFSNWDNAGNDDWSKLIAKEEGSISTADLQICIDDPASTVDISKGQYIPMSGKETFTCGGQDLNNKTKNVSVGLVRLVGKVNVSLSGADATETTDENEITTKQSETYTSLTIDGFADKVWLFSEITNNDAGNAITNNKSLDYSDEINALEDKEVTKEGITLTSRYVNETTTTDGFKVTLGIERTEATTASGETKTTEPTPVTMEANTTLTAIPRNNVFPLVLSLDNYELELTVEAYTAGIGTEQTTYTNGDRDEDAYLYIINLREITSSFTITPKIYDVSVSGTKTEVSSDGITWVWKKGEDVLDSTDGAYTETGPTATEGYDETYTLSASWDSDGHTITRTYTIVVKYSSGSFSVDKDSYEAPAYDSWGSVSLPQERIYMTTSKRSE